MVERFISRGFRGRRQKSDVAGRLPPGQHLERGFPVLSAGPTPHTPLDRWDFSTAGKVEQPKRWTWDELHALSQEQVTADIHCETKWSKLDTHWQGVSVQTLLEQVTSPESARYVIAFSDGGYTTNLPLADMLGGKVWIAYAYEGDQSHLNTGDLRGCLSPTSPFGRAPSGCGACNWSSRINPDSGSRLVTTPMEIHGKNSATGATSLATR